MKRRTARSTRSDTLVHDRTLFRAKDASFASARGAEYVCNAGRGAPSQPTITNHIKKRAATPANPYATTQRAILLGGSDEQQTDAVVLADMEHVFRLSGYPVRVCPAKRQRQPHLPDPRRQRR